MLCRYAPSQTLKKLIFPYPFRFFISEAQNDREYPGYSPAHKCKTKVYRMIENSMHFQNMSLLC
jgi:hypothetical protein